MALGVDVGGTFTDIVHVDGTRLTTTKTSTTRPQHDGVLAGCRALTDHATVLLHGTTVATNALLERRGARTALVCNEGFADLIEIGRQDRPSLYDPFADRPEPLVGREGRIEATDLDALVAQLHRFAPEAIAICLLHASRDADGERRLLDALSRHFDVPICASHAVVGEFREFERTSTTVLNAYLTPVVADYLGGLAVGARRGGVADTIEVMRSSGGLMDIGDAQRLPAAVLLSGPAGGVVAAAALGDALGHRDLVSFDMGGTSTDVCRIVDGRPTVAYERDIDGFACRMPSVAVHTVGAGGGSIGWRDHGGALRVGPRSAGAIPGPACYGRGGTEPTITDANLILGRLDAAAPFADDIVLDVDAATAALAGLADTLGIDETTAAHGMVRVAEAHMERAIRVVSVEEGADPRDAALVSFGGAGGLHATALARALDMAAVFVPPHAGVFSALGLLLSPRRADAARSTRHTSTDGLAERIAEVTDRAQHALSASHAEVRPLLDVRYVGQAHETTIDLPRPLTWEAIAGAFHEAHRQRNGFARPGDPIEVVTVRAEATAPAAMRFSDLPEPNPEGPAEIGQRRIRTDDGGAEAKLIRRAGLAAGDEFDGPAVIIEDHATTLLASDERVRVDDSGTLVVEW
ncbi:MAG: hydantoinase/oxoprolinase family protein [Nitriliruptoraceae bacterium]